ncbi:MAG: SPASM domain-containing protein [Bacteroidota bacterium]
MKNKNKNYFIKQISENEVLVYNSIKHIPMRMDKVGKKYFDIILKYDKKSDWLKNISLKEHESFKDFYKTLKNVNFLSDTEDFKNLTYKLNKSNKLFYLHLTDKCNLKCIYCYNKGYRKNKKDLDYNKWKIIIDKVMPYSRSIILIGGEVILHKSFGDLVQYIKKNIKIKLTLISNGSLDYEKLKLNNAFRLIDVINLSCDNIKDNEHERMNFNRKIFFKNINFLKKIGLKQKIIISSVWTKKGTDKIKDVECFCKKNGLKFNRTIRIPNNHSEIKMMPSVKSHYNYFENNNNLYKATTDNVDENVGRFEFITCGAGYNTFSIDAIGNCYPCQSFHFPEFKLGNLLKNDFEYIYNSNISTMFRVTNNVNYKMKCKNCNLKYLCGGGCIADTYKLEGNLLEHPKTMCPYYKNGAIVMLKNEIVF